jgi:hypothetical protein
MSEEEEKIEVEDIGAAFIYARINEKEKWAYAEVWRTEYLATEEEKVELLKKLKDLINKFIECKYDSIYVAMVSTFLTVDEKDMEYLINYKYKNLNDPLPAERLFAPNVGVYAYRKRKEADGKCVMIEKRLEPSFIYEDPSYILLEEIKGSVQVKECKT